MMWIGLCLCLAAGLLTGCLGQGEEEAGVVATVNGAPIRLAELEDRHDFARLGLPRLDNPAVEELRAEYGATLADLIVARLVAQELARLGLTPGAVALAAAEQAVRADYPGDSFERLLLEEHIDLARWRALLADRLALETFSRDVLRPTLRVGVAEAAGYYKEHIQAFTRPAKVRLLVVSGRDAESVKAGLAAARKTPRPQPGEAADGWTIQEAALPESGLPGNWRDALRPLKPGDATAPMVSGREYRGLILVERLPSSVLDPAKAYARVESMLAAEKLDKAFDAWLAETLAGTSVRVNRRLLASGNPAVAESSRPPLQADQAEIETARSESQARDYLAGQARRTLAEKRSAADAAPQAAAPAPSSPPDLPPAAVAEALPAAPVASGTQEAGPAAQAEPSHAVEVAARPDQPDQPDQSAQSGQSDQPGPSDQPAQPALPGQPGPSAAPAVAAAAAHDPAPVPAATDPAPPPPDATASLGAPAVETAASGASQTPPLVEQARFGPGEVEFSAIKASWILYTIDEGREERVYLKPGKPQRIAYARRLTVRLGSPSEVAYRVGDRETVVEVGKKESRVLEFP
ncbi:peptidylprolyl isomerase [Solidesulfovibrio sp.]